VKKKSHLGRIDLGGSYQLLLCNACAVSTACLTPSFRVFWPQCREQEVKLAKLPCCDAESSFMN
jgi:hypothetical protein